MVNFNKTYKKLSVIIILCLSLIFIVISIYICNYKNHLNKLFMVREIKQQEREIKSKLEILSERNISEGENHEFERFLKSYINNDIADFKKQREEVDLELSNLQKKNNYILDISILDSEGKVIESSLKSNIEKEMDKDRKDVLELSIIYKCSSYFDYENKCFNLISPIYDKKTGEVLGYYSKSMSIRYVQDILKLYNRSNSEYSILILNDENFITESSCEIIDIESLKNDNKGSYYNEVEGGVFIKFTNCNGDKMRAIISEMQDIDSKIIYSMRNSDFAKDIARLIILLFITCALICISFLYLAKRILNNIRYDLEHVSKMIYEYEKTGKVSDEFLLNKKMFNLIGKEIFNIIKRFELEKVNYDYMKNKSKLDCLTGFLNKEYTKKYIEEYIRESNGGGAFILFDLDNFKGINDNFGHQFGDEVLKEISKNAREIFRDSDIFGRIGGDEFVVFIRGNNIEHIIDSMLIRLSEVLKGRFSKGNISHEITGSIGVSLYPKDANNYEELYNNADIAMYHSKENGKNKFTIYSKEIKTKSQIEDESINKAIEMIDKIKNDLHNSIKLFPVKTCKGETESYILNVCNNENNTKYIINDIMESLSTYGLNDNIYANLLKEVFNLIENIQSQNKDIVIDIMTLFKSVPYENVIDTFEVVLKEIPINTKNIRVFLSNTYIDFLGYRANILIQKLKFLGFKVGIIEFSTDKFLYKNYSKYSVDEVYILNNEINSIIREEEGESLIKHTISYYNSIGINITFRVLEQDEFLKIKDLEFKYYNSNEGIDIKNFI